MNETEQILVELKKITAYTEVQRKVTKGSLIFLGIFMSAFIMFVVVTEMRSKKKVECSHQPSKATWYDFRQHINSGSFDEAITVGEQLIQETPLYPNGHQMLGTAYLAVGQLEKARQHFAEAARLFPSKESESYLEAIDVRIKKESAQQGVGR